MKNKAFEFRIYPNKEQRILLAKTFGCTRLVYNYFLSLRKEIYDESGELPQDRKETSERAKDTFPNGERIKELHQAADKDSEAAREDR